jgi:hypothetical protein
MTLRAIGLSRLPVGSSARRARGAGERAGDGHALLLAAGELRGEVLHARGEADFLQRVLDAVAPLGRGEAAVAQRHVDVVEEVEVRDEVEALEDEAKLLVPQPRALVVRKALHAHAVERELAAVELLEQPGDVEEGGLARARGPVTVTNSPFFTSMSKPRSAWVSIMWVR